MNISNNRIGFFIALTVRKPMIMIQMEKWILGYQEPDFYSIYHSREFCSLREPYSNKNLYSLNPGLQNTRDPKVE